MFDSPPPLPSSHLRDNFKAEGIYNSLNLWFGYLQLNCEDTFFSSEQNYFNSHNQHNQI